MTDSYLDIEFDETQNEDLIDLIGEVCDNNETDLISSLDEETMIEYATIELSSVPTEITISAGMTRQKIQFCPNVYHASIKIDISRGSDYIINRVASTVKGKRVETFVKLRKYFTKSLLHKIDKYEMMLRRALISRARADNTALPEDK